MNTSSPVKAKHSTALKLRNLSNGRVWERTFKSGEKLEGADVMDQELEYSYTDGEFWYFMDPVSFEQSQADEAAVGETVKWLKEQQRYEVTLFNDAPIAVSAPNFIDLEVAENRPRR